MRVSTQKPSTARFVSPEGAGQLEKKLKTTKTNLRAAQKDLAAQQRLMRTARFTPEGYKLAQAKLKSLETKVTKLTHEVERLTNILRTA